MNSVRQLQHLKLPSCVSRGRGIHMKTQYDAVVVGAGHNGLVALCGETSCEAVKCWFDEGFKAAYLQKAGLNVCVVENRHIIGGATVTEEIVPGFKFSRASYLLSLFRPQIMKDLELKKYGLKVFLRNPSSYTPLKEPGGLNGKVTSLLLGRDSEENARQIAQFSTKDAEAFSKYEEQLDRIVNAIDPLLDSPPLSLQADLTMREKWNNLTPAKALMSSFNAIGKDLPGFYDIMTAPAQKVLNRWFESEPLKATLATDSVIGAMASPQHPGSGYVLLHHVMGELEGIKGAWGYVEGGMGSVAKAIANCATDHGASIFTDKPVAQVITDQGKAQGVVLKDGTEIRSKLVLSNATPKVTYLDLLEENCLPVDLIKELKEFDYTSPVTKINVAVDRIPNFLADKNVSEGVPMPHHQCTIHLNCEDSQLIHDAYVDAQQGKITERPMIEMVIPSVLDQTLCPAGKHVILLFTQFTPYHLADGEWDDANRNKYADIVFDTIERYAPGFKESVIGRDILTPPDLERIIGLTGGNIFHGAMTLDQLYFTRPNTSLANCRSPVAGLYLCGSGAHPGSVPRVNGNNPGISRKAAPQYEIKILRTKGKHYIISGGVMGAPGRIAANAALADFKAM